MKRNFIKSMALSMSLLFLMSGCSANKEEGKPIESVDIAASSVADANTTDLVEPGEVVLTPEEQKTIDSLTEVTGDIYLLDCYSDYKLEDYLASNITDSMSMDYWLTAELTHNIPTGNLKDFGCSSFATLSDAGDHLFGRNYDIYNGKSLVVRTAPKDGYASIGIVDLNHLNMYQGSYDIDSEDGKLLLLAAPWCICDGINEMGLGMSVLQLDETHVVTDTEKGDLMLYAATRVVLDKCATVDEAIELLDSFDMYSPKDYTYHFFITDQTGKSVVAEWCDGEFVVVEDTAVTNFMLYTVEGEITDGRYNKLHATLDVKDSMTTEEAMDLLKSVYNMTRWSAVYNLENFTVDVCFNVDMKTTYSFDGRINTDVQ